jgi:hypothetical protein
MLTFKEHYFVALMAMEERFYGVTDTLISSCLLGIK